MLNKLTARSFLYGKWLLIWKGEEGVPPYNNLRPCLIVWFLKTMFVSLQPLCYDFHLNWTLEFFAKFQKQKQVPKNLFFKFSRQFLQMVLKSKKLMGRSNIPKFSFFKKTSIKSSIGANPLSLVGDFGGLVFFLALCIVWKQLFLFLFI